MKDVNNRKIRKGKRVWMTTPACTGRGIIVKINKRTCHVQCGSELIKRTNPEELELEI